MLDPIDLGETEMLILAECRLPDATADTMRKETYAWLGPMTDAGFMQGGWVDEGGRRAWMVVAADSLHAANQRLSDLPGVKDGTLTFTTTPVTALRFR